MSHSRGSRGGGGQGGPDPTSPEKSHHIGLHSKTGPDPLKNHSYQASNQCWAIIGPPAKHNLGHHRPASETLFKWRFAGRPMMARLKCAIWILSLSLSIKTKAKTKQTKNVRIGPSLAKLSGSVHEQVHRERNSSLVKWLSTCTGDNPLSKACGLSPRTSGHTHDRNIITTKSSFAPIQLLRRGGLGW